MERLIKRAKNGDAEAFILLMEENKESMKRIACAYLKREEDAADAIQDTILDAYEHIHKLRKPEHFKTWLTRILLNNCTRIYRQNKAQPAYGLSLQEYESISAQDIVSGIEAESDLEFQSLLSHLPEVDAETYDLYIDEYMMPDNFQMQLQIDRFWGYPEWEGQEGPDDYRINGIWTIPDALEIRQSKQDSTTIWINETNEEGIGMEYIEISPIELTLHPYEGADRMCVAVALDKDGRWIENGSTNFYELAIQDHDTSVITVYVCDYDEYMDELKGIRIQQGDAAFQDVLEERALYKKIIEVENQAKMW